MPTYMNSGRSRVGSFESRRVQLAKLPRAYTPEVETRDKHTVTTLVVLVVVVVVVVAKQLKIERTEE